MKEKRIKAMVKGCQRKSVVLKCPASSAFESAYFILKNGADRSFSEEDVISQANRIVEESALPVRKRKRGGALLWAALSFLAGALVSSGATALILRACC